MKRLCAAFHDAGPDFWRRFQACPLNERQRKVVNLLLDAHDLCGRTASSKYPAMAKANRSTACPGLELENCGKILNSRC